MVLVALVVAAAVKTAEHHRLTQKRVAQAVSAVTTVIQTAVAQAELEPTAHLLVLLLTTVVRQVLRQVEQVVAAKALSAVRQHYCPKRALMRLLLHLCWVISQAAVVAVAVTPLVHH